MLGKRQGIPFCHDLTLVRVEANPRQAVGQSGGLFQGLFQGLFPALFWGLFRGSVLDSVPALFWRVLGLFRGILFETQRPEGPHGAMRGLRDIAPPKHYKALGAYTVFSQLLNCTKRAVRKLSGPGKPWGSF